MIDFLESIGIDPMSIVIVIAISAIMFIVLYRKFVFSIFDPLSFFLIILIADSTLMFSLPWKPSLKWEYVAFMFSFWLGFALRGRIPITHPKIQFKVALLFELEVVLFLLFLIIIVANIYLGVSVGFPLFSSNPSASKVTVFTGGLGLVRRINTGASLFFSCGCTLMAVIGHRRTLAVAMLLTSTFFIALGGSKSTLLPLVYELAFLLAHRGLKSSAHFRKGVRKYTLSALLAGTGVALLVLARDKGGIAAGIQAFFIRILFSGDVILYYFPRRDAIMAFTDQTVVGYLHHLLSDVLGMFRLMDYEESLGSVILGAGDSGFGPNAQYFIEADLFFGAVYGCIYSFIVGYLIAYFRRRFFVTTTRSPVLFTSILAIASYAFALAIDSTMFIAGIATMAISVIPLWLVARWLRLAAQDMSGTTRLTSVELNLTRKAT